MNIMTSEWRTTDLSTWSTSADMPTEFLIESGLNLWKSAQSPYNSHCGITQQPYSFPAPPTATGSQYDWACAQPGRLPVIRAGPPATENVKLAAVSGWRAARPPAAFDSCDTNHRYSESTFSTTVFRACDRKQECRVGQFEFKNYDCTHEKLEAQNRPFNKC